MAKPKKKSSKKIPAIRGILSKQPAWFSNKKLHCLFIFGICFLLYANTITHDYTQDDAIVIYDNEFTAKGIAGIPDILKYDTFRGFFKVEGKDKLVSGGRYRPLTLVMFAIEVELFGQSTVIGHLMNIFWYGLTCVLLYILLLRMLTAERGEETYAYFVALAAALIFAAHPLHTEAVANIKGRDEIIALLGALATAYLCLRSWQDKKPAWSIAAGVIFFLTLFSKENAITFLGVIPLMFLFFTKASIKDIAIQLGPIVAGTLVFLFIRSSIIGGGIGEPPIELMNNPFVKVEGNQYVHFSDAERLGTIFYTLLKYIQLQIFPHPLTHDYYPRHIGIISMTDWRALLSLLLHIGLLAYAAIRFTKKDPISFAILFYMGTLFIVSNLLFPIGTNMAERLIFMPSVGFCLIVGVLLYRLAIFMNNKNALTNFKQLSISLGILGLIIAAFSVKTITRNLAWKDNYTLFLTDVAVSENSAKLQNSVGGELLAQSRKEKNETKQSAMVLEAIPHLEKAIKLHPNYKNAYLLLGNAYNYSKNYEQAINAYNQALRIEPGYPDAMRNIGICYRENKQFDKAAEQFAALKNVPLYEKGANADLAYTYEEAGKHFGNQGQHQRAIAYFQKALTHSDDKGKHEYFIGLAYARLNDANNAILYMEKALNSTEKQENKSYISRSLGDIYKNIDPAKSQSYYQQADQLKGQ